MPRDTWDNLNLWSTESWCSDTSSRGSLKAGSILPCESFEHLSLKRDRNQKHNLTTELRFQNCLRLFIIHDTSLLVVGACLTWQQAPCLWLLQLGNTCLRLDACKHMSLEPFSSAFAREIAVKLKLAAEAEWAVGAASCLTLLYLLQSHKDVVVLVRCSQQLIREGLRLQRTNALSYADNWGNVHVLVEAICALRM